MTTILQILDEIAATDSTTLKQQMLKLAAAGPLGETLKKIYYLTYCKQVQFGIKKIPEYDNSVKLVRYEIENVLEFLEEDLAKRVLTGNTAIQALTQKLDALHPDDAKVIERVIKRDLECGASRTIANKVWPKLIPEQPQMLATAYSEKAIQNIKFPAMAQLKADGARCFAEIRGPNIEDVKLLSRAGNEYLGLDNIKKELLESVSDLLSRTDDGLLIDGELVYVPESQNVTTDVLGAFMDDDYVPEEKPSVAAIRSESNGIANKSLKGTISKVEAQSMSFQVWDITDLKVYRGAKSQVYKDRYQLLTEVIKPGGKLIVIESTVVHSLEEAREVYKKYVDQGLEGIILKNMLGLWENKRSKNQVKFKEEIQVDMVIVGYYPHNKDPNKLGGITVETKCKRVRVNCGSGFTDTTQIKKKGQWVPIPLEHRDVLDREALMFEGDELIGRIVQIKCNGWIKAEKRIGQVGLFLPIMECFRDDKTDANTFEEAFGIPFEVTGA